MLLFADTFNTYGTNTALMLNGLYAAVANSSLGPDPTGAPVNVFQTTSNPLNGYRLRRVFNSSKTTAGFGLRLWLTTLPPNNVCVPVFNFLDGASGQQISVSIDTVGKLNVHQGWYGAGILLGVTTGPVVTANAWHHIEFKATANAVTGSFEARINGVPVLTVAGVNTGTDYSQFCVECPNASAITLAYYIKDLVLWDGTGTYNNNFMGSVSVLDLLPDSDVSFNWAASTGTTGYNLINDIPPVDTSYVSAAFPVPAASVFGLQNLPADVTSVKAMIPTIRAEKIDGGDGSLQMAMKSGASTGLGSDRPMTVAYTYWQDIFEVDPATTLPWTPGAANAAQLQINRTV